MLAEISAGFQSLKAAFDITKGMNAANTQAAINEVKIPLQEHIVNAQQALAAANEAQTAATERIRELEQQIVHLKDWEREKQRYQMKRFTPGSVAYCLKMDMADGEPPHRICPHCYQEGKKGFLQATVDLRGGKRVHVCTSCRADAILGQEMPDYETAEPVEPPEPPARPYDRFDELKD